MRHRAAAVLMLAGLAGCAIDAGDSDQSDGARAVVPSPEAREYCALVRDFYAELGEFVDRALASGDPEAVLDQRFVGFVREHQDLFERLAAAAPDAIAADSRAQQQAFAAVATEGALAPLETEAYRAAEARTVAYEEEECGVVVEG